MNDNDKKYPAYFSDMRELKSAQRCNPPCQKCGTTFVIECKDFKSCQFTHWVKINQAPELIEKTNLFKMQISRHRFIDFEIRDGVAIRPYYEYAYGHVHRCDCVCSRLAWHIMDSQREHARGNS